MLIDSIGQRRPRVQPQAGETRPREPQDGKLATKKQKNAQKLDLLSVSHD